MWLSSIDIFFIIMGAMILCSVLFTVETNKIKNSLLHNNSILWTCKTKYYLSWYFLFSGMAFCQFSFNETRRTKIRNVIQFRRVIKAANRICLQTKTYSWRRWRNEKNHAESEAGSTPGNLWMHVGKKVAKEVSHERFGCSLPTFSVGVLLSMRIDARVTTRRRSLTIQSITFF